MAIDDKSRTRFTLNDMPGKAGFEKGGVKMPVMGKKFSLVESRLSPAGMSVQRTPARFTPGKSQGFSPREFMVKVPEFKSPKVEIKLGLEGEAKRAFKPLVQIPPGKGLTRDR